MAVCTSKACHDFVKLLGGFLLWRAFETIAAMQETQAGYLGRIDVNYRVLIYLAVGLFLYFKYPST